MRVLIVKNWSGPVKESLKIVREEGRIRKLMVYCYREGLKYEYVDVPGNPPDEYHHTLLIRRVE